MKKVVMFVAALGVAAVLSACGSSSVSGEAAGTISGQVADYSGPAGVLEATSILGGKALGTGSIDTDGTFSLELDKNPSNLAGGAVVPTASACPNVNVSDAQVKGTGVTEVNIIAAGEVVGQLYQSSIFDEDAGDSFSVVTRLYVDRDVLVKGNCTFRSEGTEFRATYDADYRQGWNVALAETTTDIDTSTYTARYTNGSPADVAWYYISLE